ncbi:hypothetical protein TSOC_007873 [Tetrabaena socialis]|uniref:Uncharacterized protein n=1 Tax=Tetrabaena socialis TaxID=47790 RepID=A0A2J7ZZY8_9CHLO|nr:hypothetical protein TSOC_007873 [Tetrabaena socialis]|eukprot:PNH05833.1 hypothetical protein TSOC_007873 [Tetrabaena socialis]
MLSWLLDQGCPMDWDAVGAAVADEAAQQQAEAQQAQAKQEVVAQAGRGDGSHSAVAGSGGVFRG